MRTLLPNRRAKKLLKVLWALQQEDAEFTAFMTQKVKYDLPYNKHCDRIRVDGVEAMEANDPPITYHRSSIPRFIASQLETWDLIDTHTDFVDVFSLVHFIIGQLPDFENGDTRAYPHIFCWPSQFRSRTIFLFAFLNVKMPSQKYSIEELLHFRDAWHMDKFMTQSLRSLRSLAEINPDLGESN
jgi:hypothetical protein